jgi:hypothetical protein
MTRGRDIDDREIEIPDSGQQAPHIRDLERNGRDPEIELGHRSRAGDGIAPEKESTDPLDELRYASIRDRRVEIWTRDHTYALSASELETMHEIRKFRTVSAEDLGEFCYRGDSGRMTHELRHLADQGLLRRQMVKTPDEKRLDVLVLTRAGKRLIESRNRSDDRESRSPQRVYADLKKPAEIFHDTAIYRMYQAEAARIRARGGRVRRVVLDYELKKRAFIRRLPEPEPSLPKSIGNARRKSPRNTA